MITVSCSFDCTCAIAVADVHRVHSVRRQFMTRRTAMLSRFPPTLRYTCRTPRISLTLRVFAFISFPLFVILMFFFLRTCLHSASASCNRALYTVQAPDPNLKPHVTYVQPFSRCYLPYLLACCTLCGLRWFVRVHTPCSSVHARVFSTVPDRCVQFC